MRKTNQLITDVDVHDQFFLVTVKYRDALLRRWYNQIFTFVAAKIVSKGGKVAVMFRHGVKAEQESAIKLLKAQQLIPADITD
jgi:hypothetical protein